jgi:hypothetical protein
MRSYLIWQREGCPHGRALDHWLRAKAELEAEMYAVGVLEGPLPSGQLLRKPLSFVAPRVPVSSPPRRSVATRIAPERQAS